MFVTSDVFKQCILFIFPSTIYLLTCSCTLLSFTNSLSEPHVSKHVDPSIGRKVTVGDDVGIRLTVGGDVGDDEWVTVGGDDMVGDSVGTLHMPQLLRHVLSMYAEYTEDFSQ